MAKTKLLFVIGSMELGGAQKALVNLINELDKEKYDISVQLCVQNGFNLQYLPEYVSVFPPFALNNEYYHGFGTLIKEQIKKGHLWVALRRIFYAILAKLNDNGSAVVVPYYQWKFVRKYIKPDDREYDVAIGYLDGLSHYYVIDKVKAKRKICWVHSDYSKMPTYKGVFSYLKKADNVITVSPQCLKEINKFFPKLSNTGFLYNINSPSMVKKLSNEPMGDDFSSPNGELKILCIGRLCQEKGYNLAVGAAKILKEKGFSFNWSIIGGGPLHDELSKQIKECGVEDVFHLLGTKQNPYLRRKVNCHRRGKNTLQAHCMYRLQHGKRSA